MVQTIIHASDEELKRLNSDFHNGIDMDRRMGHKVHDVVLKVNRFIEQEMHKRNLKTWDDMEEEIFFSHNGRYENLDAYMALQDGVKGYTQYLQGIDLPIMVNSIQNGDECSPSEVSEMHIGNVNGKLVVLITPEIISM